jgi:flagellar biosynthesis chaperone FliJ
MSSSDPLQTLLAVRKAAEAAAAEALAGALRRRAAAEGAQLSLDVALRAARDDLWVRRQAAASMDVEIAARAGERERFWARLAEGIAVRAARARAHRHGELAAAQADAAAAQAAHRAAQGARQQVQKVSERAASARRLITGRRAEAALDEEAQAMRPFAGVRDR